MISFIVPAHNEQACLGRSLQAIHESARVVGQPYEIIVVDDASTDATAEIALQNHARVVSVNHRQIAATRNSGGRAAHGEQLIFVDADTTANSRAVASALRYMDKGAAGGGAPTWFDYNDAAPFQLSTPIALWLDCFRSNCFAAVCNCRSNDVKSDGLRLPRHLYTETWIHYRLFCSSRGKLIAWWRGILGFITPQFYA